MKKPAIGSFDEHIEIQHKVIASQDDYGVNVFSWLKKARVWAELQDTLPSRSETTQGTLAVGSNKTRVRMRYRTDIDSAMRFTARGTVYQFISGPAMIGRNEYMEFLAEEYTS